MGETQRLLSEIDGFLRGARMAESTFGRKAVNDGKLVPRLRAGQSVTLDKAGQIRRFMVEYRAPILREAV